MNCFFALVALLLANICERCHSTRIIELRPAEGVEEFHRSIRSYPYSIIPSLGKEGNGIYRRSLSEPGYSDDEMSNLPDSMDSEYLRNRRSPNGLLLKRYACRFKFCRIFDA